MLEALNQDIRSACRGLWRAKAFTAAAILTLALGITGTAVMFAVIDGVLLRPLPVRDQDRLLLAWKELRASRFAHYPFGGPDVEAVVEASQLLESGAGVTSNGAVAWVAVERRHRQLRSWRAGHRRVLRGAGHPPVPRTRIDDGR